MSGCGYAVSDDRSERKVAVMGEERKVHGEDAGSSTDQHVTGAEETEASPVDTEPTADTPAHGSGNAGIDVIREGRERLS